MSYIWTMTNLFQNKSAKLFAFISAFFVANALIAECIGGKIFSLEAVFGITPADISLFGEQHLSFALTCGVLLWPLEFVMTDIVNEYYGPKAVRRISYIAIGLIAYAFIMFYLAIHVSAPSWWIHSKEANGVPDMQMAFEAIFGQGMWIIFGSMAAFMFSQLVDVFVFHKIKQKTGDKYVWLRATGSTLVSQFIDSFIILFIAFYWGGNWSWQKVLAICMMNYTYKFTMAIILTPLIYLVENRIDKYLGKETALKMKRSAMGINDTITDMPIGG